MTKKEKIQESYENLDIDWRWISLFIDFSTGFNFKTDIRLTLNSDDLEIVENHIGIMWRPKSIQGIEDNKGWIKIESEEGLPKDDTIQYHYYNLPDKKRMIALKARLFAVSCK
jgi:hypothetical protein